MVPPPTSTRHGQERRRKILSTAVDVFGEAGFAGARIDEVARRVGIQRPSILYHFPDKRALYAAAIGLVLQDITDRIRATETEPTERLEAIADSWVDFMITRPNAARLLLRQMLDAIPLSTRTAMGRSGTRDEIRTPVGALLGSIQSAIDDRAHSMGQKTMDAGEFALILSSTSLVWFASRNAIEGTLGLDTLSPRSVQRHRRTLHALIRQLVQATDDSPEAASGQKKASSRHPFGRLLLSALLAGLLANPVFPVVSASETVRSETVSGPGTSGTDRIDLSDFDGHWQRIEDPTLEEKRVSAIERALSGLSWIVRRMASGILRKSTTPPEALQFTWNGESLEQELKGVEGPEKRPILLDGKMRRAVDGRGVPFASAWAWSENGLRLNWRQHQATGNNLYRLDERGDLLIVQHTIQVTAISNIDPIVFESRFVRRDLPRRASLDLDASRPAGSVTGSRLD